MELPLLGHVAVIAVLSSFPIPKVDRVSLNVADSDHSGSEAGADLHKDLGVVVVGDSLNDGSRAGGGVGRLEDSGPNKDSVEAELHHEGSVGGGGDSSGSEVDDGKLAGLGDLLDELVGGLHLLGSDKELIVSHDREGLDLTRDGPGVADGLDNVSGSGLSLGAEHAGSLSNAAKGLPEVAASADEGDGELVLVNVVFLVGHSEDLRLVDVVNLEGLEDLGLDKVSDAGLGHDRDGNGVLDLLNHDRVRHAGNTAVLADVGGDTLEGHDGDGSGLRGGASGRVREGSGEHVSAWLWSLYYLGSSRDSILSCEPLGY